MSAEIEKTALIARFLWRLSDNIEARSGLDDPEKTCKVLHQSAERMLALQDEKTQLERWKAEAMAVSASWDVQAVGKLIGAQPGTDICPQIEPFLRAIIAERDGLKARLAEPTPVQSWKGMPPEHAHLLIERHANDWYQAGEMLRAWAEANYGPKV